MTAWTGAGAPDGPMGVHSVGPGDTPPDQVVGAVSVASGRIIMAPTTGQQAYARWPVQPSAEWAVRVSVVLGGDSSLSHPVLQGLTAERAQAWRLDLSGSAGGTPRRLRIRDAAGTQLAEATSPIPLGAAITLEVSAAAGTVTVLATHDESATVVAAIVVPMTPPPMAWIRLGHTLAAPAVAAWSAGDLATTTTRDWIGPASAPLPGTITVDAAPDTLPAPAAPPLAELMRRLCAALAEADDLAAVRSAAADVLPLLELDTGEPG